MVETTMILDATILESQFFYNKDNDLLHLSPNLVMFQQLRSIELIPQDINFVTVNFDIFPKCFEVHKIYSHCLKD